MVFHYSIYAASESWRGGESCPVAHTSILQLNILNDLKEISCAPVRSSKRKKKKVFPNISFFSVSAQKLPQEHAGTQST